MYIQSKLKQLQKDLFKIDTSEIEKTATLKEEKYELKGSWGAANSHIVYGNGFAVINSQFEADIDLTDVFTIEEEYIQLSFFISGEPNFIDELSQKRIIELGLVQLFYARDNTFTVHMGAHKKAQYCCLLFERDFFLKLFKNERWFKDQPFYDEVHDKRIQELRRLVFPLNFTSFSLINELFSNEFSNPFDYCFFELKIKEIFLTLLAGSSQKKLGDSQSELSEVTRKKVKEAHRYITLNFRKTPKLKELSKIILLNELQLKKGFKGIYGVTIRAYIIELKMKAAKTLLIDNSVNETAGMLDYKSVSHFIASFKKHYGFTPKQIANVGTPKPKE